MTVGSPIPFFTRLLRFIASPSIWFLHFAFIYSLPGFGGAFGLTTLDVKLFGWISTVVAAVGVLGMIIRTRHSRKTDSLENIAYLIGILSLVAISLQTLAFWLVP
jgi:hypothetical protein